VFKPKALIETNHLTYRLSLLTPPTHTHTLFYPHLHPPTQQPPPFLPSTPACKQLLYWSSSPETNALVTWGCIGNNHAASSFTPAYQWPTSKPSFKGGPEPLKHEINEILGSKRKDRFSESFLDLVQNTCWVCFSCLFWLHNFLKGGPEPQNNNPKGSFPNRSVSFLHYTLPKQIRPCDHPTWYISWAGWSVFRSARR